MVHKKSRILRRVQIKTDFQIDLDEKQLIAVQGKRFERLLSRPGIAISFHLMKEKIEKISHQAIGWQRFKVEGVDHDKLILKNGVSVGGGAIVEAMKGATEVVIAVCTIGPEVDAEIDHFQKNKEMMNAVVFDNLANWLVDQTRQQFMKWFEKEFESEELFHSIIMGPGENWDIKDQKTLFQLLGEEELKTKLGVILTDSMLMIPMKSLSFMFGLSPEPFGMKNKTKCDFCIKRDTCRYREIQPENLSKNQEEKT